MTITGQIRKVALELLADKPEGIMYQELRKAIQAVNASFNFKTIAGAIWDLDTTYPNDIYKPDRGVFRLLKFKDVVLTQPDQAITTKKF